MKQSSSHPWNRAAKAAKEQADMRKGKKKVWNPDWIVGYVRKRERYIESIKDL